MLGAFLCPRYGVSSAVMDTEQYGRYTVREAAIRLGISEAAVRQRIRRHTLVAERSDGIVYVVLADDTPSYTAASTPDNTPFETVIHTPSDTPDSTAIMLAARSQFEAIRDEWLAPLVDRIGELEREAGRLTAEVEHERQRVATVEAARVISQQRAKELEQERDALRSRVSELEQRKAELPQPVQTAPQGLLGRAWRAFRRDQGH